MLKQIIENILVPAEDFIYGFANLEGLLDEEYREYSYGIAIGKHLDDRIIDSIKNGPTLEYYNHYKKMNDDLTDISIRICNELRKCNINCINIEPTIPLESDEFSPYLETLRYKISHKMIATRAGLGWIGKTDLFVSKAFGPRVRLTSILIDAPIEITGNAIDKSRCGSCDICVESCPAQAANGKLWDIYTDRNEFFDPHKCYDKCAELAKTLFDKDIRICGICVSVCPIGKKE